MALSEFAGVFSRYFVIGFFAPAFFAAVILSQLVDQRFFPDAYVDASAGAQLAVLGGVGLLAGLVLSGLHYHVTRLFEGYPLVRWRDKPLIGPVHDGLLGHWLKAYDDLHAALDGEPSPERTKAAQQLSRCFPVRRETVLPTRFGNAVRSFETHGRPRYGLDGISAWPRISLLLTDPERQQVEDAQTDVAMFLNVSFVVGLAAAALSVDRLLHEPAAGWATVQIAITWLVAAAFFWGSYRAATAAAMRWGSPVRAAFDLHRFELYERLGLKLPETQSGEEAIARATNRLLLFGEPIPDGLRAKPATTKEKE